MLLPPGLTSAVAHDGRLRAAASLPNSCRILPRGVVPTSSRAADRPPCETDGVRKSGM